MGIAGAVSTFTVLRPNRLVAGVPGSLADSGVFAFGVALAVVLALIGSFASSRQTRNRALQVASPALAAAAAWALGAASRGLLQGQPDIARVSLGPGAWLLMLSIGITWLAARNADPRPGPRRTALGLAAVLVAGAFAWGGLDSLSLAREYATRAHSFWPLVAGHLGLTGTSLLAGTLSGLPLGLWATRNVRVRAVVLGLTGAIQTVPSLALLGLLVVPLAALADAVPALAALGVRGIGAAPGFVALSLYALLPVVRGTYVGLSEVDPAALDAGRGMGMSRLQLLARVEAPLAAPLIIDGVRTSAVLLVGIATLTVLAGARNLGVLVFEGLGQFAPDLILLGALPIVALAVAADAAFGSLARALTPKGVRA